MALKLGNIDPADFKLGSQAVQKIYLGSQEVWAPVSGGFSFDFTQSETLPSGTTYVRAGGGQGWRDSSGDYRVSLANLPSWIYSGATLKGLGYRQTPRPLTNVIEPPNFNPTDDTGWNSTGSWTWPAPSASWKLGAEFTSVSKKQGAADAHPVNPLGTGTPATGCALYNAYAATTAPESDRLQWWDGIQYILGLAAETVGPQFVTDSSDQPSNSSRFRIRSFDSANREDEWTGFCVYAGNLTLDELDIAWGTEATLNAPSIAFNIPDGTYAIGAIQLGYDDLTKANTQAITVSGGTGYPLDLADFTLTSIEALQTFVEL